jgi:hypothetical protein
MDGWPIKGLHQTQIKQPQNQMLHSRTDFGQCLMLKAENPNYLEEFKYS